MRILLVAAGAALLTGTASAQELKVNPGEWSTNVTIMPSITMDGSTQNLPADVENATECWATDAQTVLKPEMLAVDGCDIQYLSGNSYTMKFNLNCNMEGVAMTGIATIDVSNDRNSFSGEVDLVSQLPNGRVNVIADMRGNRTGSCS